MMAEENRCPQCGEKLGANAPRGVCPKCLIKVGLPSGADVEKTATSDDKATSATPSGRFVPPEPAELAKQFPQLEILTLLGQGGMGAVYKARQKQLDRLVALKILPPEVSRDPAFAERFTREARSMAKLSHQHIVTLYEFGHTEDGIYYFLMEFVDGTDLRHVIQTGELGTDEALAIVPQVCEALQYAHEEGIVHRDIKPENILLDKRGRVKIADFGLARLLERPATALTLTQAGQRMGTPHYMAPEQIEGAHEVDHRADIYSLGVVFYEMLTGQLPIGQFAPPSQKVQVDVRLDKVVLKSLAHEPERRYQHASEVKTDVETITHVAPPPKSAPADVELPASKTSRLAIASLVLAILSPFTFYFTAIPAIIMGIVVLVKIPQSRGQLKGTGLAISAIALPVVLVVLVPVVACLMGMLMPAISKAKENALQTVCIKNMLGLGKAMHSYANDYDDKFPTHTKWCDLLIKYEEVPPERFRCKGAPQQDGCNYAMNKNMENVDRGSASPDMVLVFESNPGWNQSGGPELLTTDNHRGDGCNVLFVDGHVEFIKKQNLDELNW